MIVFGNVVRVIHTQDRFYRTLLFRVLPKTLDKSAGGDAPPDANDESGAAGGRDGAVALEEEYSKLRQYIVVHDNDVLPSADSRLVYTLRVSRIRNNGTSAPYTLLGVEAEAQRHPRSARFASDDQAVALKYAVDELVDIERAKPTGITGKSIVDCFGPTLRRTLTKAMRGSAAAEHNAFQSTGAIDGVLANINSVTQQHRRIVQDTLGEAFCPLDYIELAALQVGAPSALLRLSITELVAVYNCIRDVEEAAQGDAAGAEQPSTAWKSWSPIVIGRYADMLPLATIGTRRRIRSATAKEREYKSMPNAGTIDALVNTLRANQSTVATLYDFDAECENSRAVLDTLEALRILVRLPSDDDDVTTYTSGRDYDLEYEAARLLCSPDIIGRVVALTAAGDRDILDAVPRRLLHLGVVTSMDSDICYVAPTPGHAATCPYDTLSVADVIAGRFSRGRRYTAVCLVYAHAFGTDSFVHVVRALTDCGESSPPPPPITLVLVGDALNTNGSPLESDRGCVFRDICAAIRREYLPNGHLEPFLGLASESPLGPLSADEHRKLRAYTGAELPDAHACTIAATLDDVPQVVRDAGLVAVGTNSLSTALKCGGGDAKDAHTLRRYISFDELGQVARIYKTFRMVNTPQNPFVNAVSSRMQPSFEFMALKTRNGYALLDPDGGANDVGVVTPVGINHRRCCFTNSEHLASLEMHAVTRSLAGTPVRLLARVAPQPIADKLAFVVTERTGIQDIRSAFALVRKHLYIVCESRDALAAALTRNVSRPRTRLLSLLERAHQALFLAYELAPMHLLHYTTPSPPSSFPNAAGGVGGLCPPMEGPFDIYHLGSTDTDHVYGDSVGSEQGGRKRPLIAIHSLRRHVETYLRPSGADADADTDDEASWRSAPPRAPGVGGAEPPGELPGARKRRRDVSPGANEQSPLVQAFQVFASSDVDKEALFNVHYEMLDKIVKHRLWALIHSYRIGTLGDDKTDDYLDDKAATYPPAIDRDAIVRSLGRARAMRSREAGVIHMMCIIIKDSTCETWYIEAERRLALRRIGGAGAEALAKASEHAKAIAQHLKRVPSLPVERSDDDAAVDTYNLFDKMHTIRAYIRARQGGDAAAP